MGLIGQVIVDVILVAVAAIVLPVVTLGRVRLMPDDIAAQLPAGERRWHGVHRHVSGIIYLGEHAAVTALVVLVVSALALYLACVR